MFRIGFILVIVLASIFWINPELFNNLKAKAVESINPAAKEKSLIKGMYSRLDQLSKINNDKTLSEEEKIKRTNSVINDSRNLVSEIQKTNEKSDIIATVSNIFQKIFPFKEDTSPELTWTPQCQP